MKHWGIRINWEHVALWKRGLMGWFGLMAFALVAGAHLGPRPDEVLFVVCLPAVVLLPYAAFCAALALLRLALELGKHRWVAALRVYGRLMLRQ